MNLRDLESFFAVAEELHFARAAEKLHLSQPTVSEAISRLERTLGAPLFHRTSRRVEITPFGERFLAETRPPYDQLLNAHREAMIVGRDHREIQIGHTPELGHLIFPRLVELIGKVDTPPDLRWKPQLMHTHEQLAAVASGEIDMGICWQPSVTAPVVSVILAQCPFVAIMRENDPLCEVSDLRMKNLRGRQLLMSPRADNRFIDSRVDTALSAAGISDRFLSEVSRYDEIAVNVAVSSVIGLHPATIVEINPVPGLVFREIVDLDLHLNISVVSRELSATRKLLVEMLRTVTLSSLDHILSTLK